MTKKYYVAVKPRTNDLHAVHKEGCPFLPDDSKRIFLGYFKSGHDAVRKSEMHFPGTCSCRFCCKESLSVKENSAAPKWSEKVMVSVKPETPELYHQSMFCCLN